MDMLEIDLARYMVNNVDDMGHFCPIEAHTSQPGVPDYSYTIRGFNGWLELKAGSAKKPPTLRCSQWVWFRRNINAGGNPLIFAAIENTDGVVYGLIHGSKYDDVYMKYSMLAWLRAMDLKWEGRMDKRGWGQFLEALCNPHLLKTGSAVRGAK